ncbi:MULTISPECIES: hypothetical protein [unclassified Microbacterium]|uniref:hypothetical protein n=1 Tax=unclassified Microbacterium TaxID=2609290 RepID=UPI00365B5AF0
MPDPEPDLLLTREEVQAVTTEPLSTAEAGSIAEQATNAVRDYCGWRVAKRKVEQFTLSSRGGGLLMLPSLHVAGVTTVVEAGATLTEGVDFDWDADGILERLGRRWASGRRVVTVTIEHGYDACPGGIAQAIAAAVARGTLVPAGGVVSETAIGQSVTYGRTASGTAAGAMFAPEELARLDLHRVPVSR